MKLVKLLIIILITAPATLLGQVNIPIGSLEPGEELRISIDVKLGPEDSFPTGTTTIAAQALVSSDSTNDILSDDPSTTTSNDPTLTPFALIDSDNDGSPDRNDGCPADPLKDAPGTCGCGTADIDSDNDGTPNCIDACPNDTGATQAPCPSDCTLVPLADARSNLSSLVTSQFRLIRRSRRAAARLLGRNNFSQSTIRRARQIVNTNEELLRSLPIEAFSCQPISTCTPLNIEEILSQQLQNSQRLRNFARRFGARARRIASTRRQRRRASATLSASRRLFEEITAITETIPRDLNICE